VIYASFGGDRLGGFLAGCAGRQGERRGAEANYLHHIAPGDLSSLLGHFDLLFESTESGQIFYYRPKGCG
jgi:hypothetical protein